MTTLFMESGVPAPAWLIEVIRAIAGNYLMVGGGRRGPAQGELFTPMRDGRMRRSTEAPPARGQDRRYTRRPDDMFSGEQPHPIPYAPRSMTPRLDGRDYILIYRVPNGSQARPRDRVVAKFGRVEMTAQEIEVVQREIHSVYPTATFLVLRQQNALKGPGVQWVRPDGGRIDPRWVERFESWP